MGVFKRWVTSKDSNKTAYWYIRYTVHGKEKWESVGKVGEVTKTVAQLRLQDVKKVIRRGVYGYEESTLEGLEKDYIEYIKNVKKLRSWKGRETHLRVLKAFFGVKKLSQITPRDIEDFKLIYLKTHKPAGVNRVLATLRNI
jgi:hypothetical protein